MTNIKEVYNECQQIWKANKGDKKPFQYLISKLDEHTYTYFSRTQSESTTIEDIFWAHPTSVIEDDNEVGFMFRNMVENNILYMYVRSICNCVECNRDLI